MSSMSSLPKKIWSPPVQVGAPNTPASTAAFVASSSALFTSAGFRGGVHICPENGPVRVQRTRERVSENVGNDRRGTIRPLSRRPGARLTAAYDAVSMRGMELVPISPENYEAAQKLAVAPEQERFVANLYRTLAVISQ